MSASLECLRLRAAALDAIRAFFTTRGYLAVETPIRAPAPALELHIDCPPSGDWFLRASPELHLKRLLGQGVEKVFELGPCFREGERGRQHLPEFTMLEWYRAHASYTDLMIETEDLLAAVWERVQGLPAFHPSPPAPEPLARCRAGRPSPAGGEGNVLALDFSRPWTRLTVREAFLKFAGWDPVANYDAERFNLDLVQHVEPGLPKDRPVILMDYPAEAAALARCRGKVAERWELYLAGMELANAFGELTDAVEQRQRFEQCARERAALGKTVYPLDEAFLAALERGLPPCAGIALGVDRLIMILTGADTIDDVRAFVP